MRIATKLLLGGALIPLLAACEPYPGGYAGAPAYLQSSYPPGGYVQPEPYYGNQGYYNYGNQGYYSPGYSAPVVVIPGGGFGRQEYDRREYRPDERYRGRPEQYQQRQPQVQQQQYQPQRPPPQAPRQAFTPQQLPQPQAPRGRVIDHSSETSSGDRQ